MQIYNYVRPLWSNGPHVVHDAPPAIRGALDLLFKGRAPAQRAAELVQTHRVGPLDLSVAWVLVEVELPVAGTGFSYRRARYLHAIAVQGDVDRVLSRRRARVLFEDVYGEDVMAGIRIAQRRLSALEHPAQAEVACDYFVMPFGGRRADSESAPPFAAAPAETQRAEPARLSPPPPVAPLAPTAECEIVTKGAGAAAAASPSEAPLFGPPGAHAVPESRPIEATAEAASRFAGPAAAEITLDTPAPQPAGAPGLPVRSPASPARPASPVESFDRAFARREAEATAVPVASESQLGSPARRAARSMPDGDVTIPMTYDEPAAAPRQEDRGAEEGDGVAGADSPSLSVLLRARLAAPLPGLDDAAPGPSPGAEVPGGVAGSAASPPMPKAAGAESHPPPAAAP